MRLYIVVVAPQIGVPRPPGYGPLRLLAGRDGSCNERSCSFKTRMITTISKPSRHEAESSGFRDSSNQDRCNSNDLSEPNTWVTPYFSFRHGGPLARLRSSRTQ